MEYYDIDWDYYRDTSPSNIYALRSPHRAEAKRLFKLGMSVSEIATTLGISENRCYKFITPCQVTKEEIKDLFYSGNTVEDIKKIMKYEYTSRITSSIRAKHIPELEQIIQDYINNVPLPEIDRRGLSESNFNKVINETRSRTLRLVQRDTEMVDRIIALKNSGSNNAAYIAEQVHLPTIIVYNILKEHHKVVTKFRNSKEKLVC